MMWFLGFQVLGLLIAIAGIVNNLISKDNDEFHIDLFN